MTRTATLCNRFTNVTGKNPSMITGASIFHIEAVAASQKLYLFLYSGSQLYALEGCRRCGADDALIGAVDASGTSCGGFWMPSKYGHLPQPIAFRLSFPNHIAAQLVSASNPKGSITNSDLELTALMIGAISLQDHAPTANKAAFATSNNTSAVA